MEAYEPGYTSHSEVESLSDSDWLDVASSGASGDTDSVATFDDSDREDHHDRPPSRQSLVSLASSRGGVIEGWEGLIEDSADEGSVDHPAPNPDVPPSPSIAHALQAALASPSGTQDDTDEELVKAGLEQSMMSTLSASRSNSLSGSMQTSVVRSRDLRLSFPDPLTSSREQSLTNSFENLSPTELDDIPQSDAHALNAASEAAPAPAADPAPVATPEVSQKKGIDGDYSDVPAAITPDFSIVLYGLSALAKSPLLDSLLEKWAIGAGLILSCNLTHAPGVMTRVFIANGVNQGSKPSRRFVSIIDKTGLAFEDTFQPGESSQPSCPSLAIVALPSFSKVQLPAHTLYLPVVLPDPFAMVDILASSDHLLDAERQWQTLRTPPHKLTSLSIWSAPVVDSERLGKATPAQVHSALKPLFSKPQKKSIKRSVPTNAITIIAVVSAVLGYIVNGSLPGAGVTSKPLASQANMSTIGSVNATFDKTSALPSTSVPFSDSNFAIASTSPKDFGMAVFNPLTSVVATTSAVVRQPPLPSTSSPPLEAPRAPVNAPSECQCGCGLVTWPGKVPSKELSPRPSPSTSALSLDTRTKALTLLVTPSKSDVKGKGKEKVDGSAHTSYREVSLSDISTRIAGSIQEYFDFKSVVAFAKADMQELLDAIDELMLTIRRQTTSIWEQSKDTIALVRKEIRYRNARARERAQQLREMGGRLLGSVQEKIKIQTELAKENAKTIRDNIGKGGKAGWEVRKLKKALKKKARKNGKAKTKGARKAKRRANRVLAFE